MPTSAKLAALRRLVEERVLHGGAHLESRLREAAADAARTGELPPPLAAFVRKVHDDAQAITDADLATLGAAGYSDDQIFELIVAAAVGAATLRARAAEAALAAALATTVDRP